MRKRERDRIIYCRKADWYEKTLDVLDELYTALVNKEYTDEARNLAADRLNGLAIWGNADVNNMALNVLTTIGRMAKLYKVLSETKVQEEYDKLVAEYDLEIEKYPERYDAMTEAMRADLGIRTVLPPLQYASASETIEEEDEE